MRLASTRTRPPAVTREAEGIPAVGPGGGSAVDASEATGPGAKAMILKSETYNFHRLDLSRQAGFIVTIYDEDGLRLAATVPLSTSAEAFAEARRIVDNKVEGPRH
jgi:hypothetical protein